MLLWLLGSSQNTLQNCASFPPSRYPLQNLISPEAELRLTSCSSQYVTRHSAPGGLRASPPAKQLLQKRLSKLVEEFSLWSLTRKGGRRARSCRNLKAYSVSQAVREQCWPWQGVHLAWFSVQEHARCATSNLGTVEVSSSSNPEHHHCFDLSWILC